MKSIEKATNNMKMVYSILCNLKKCTIFELQKLTKFVFGLGVSAAE